MKRWPLKLKFGIYAAALTTLALILTAALTLPFIYFRQLAELDKTLTEDAQDLFKNLENLPGELGGRQPVSSKFIPLPLKSRYIELRGPAGDVLYRSATLTKNDISKMPEGFVTVILSDPTRTPPSPTSWNARIGTFRKNAFTLRVGTRLGTIERMQQDLRAAFTFAMPFMAIGVFLGGLLLGRRALRPVAAITAAAERISAHQPGERLPIPQGKDEIARLTVVLNDSFDRLQRAYMAEAQFSADASHQLKTPVAILRAGLEELRHCESLKDEDREMIDALLRQTRRLTALVEDLLLLAQVDAGRLKLEPMALDLIPCIDVLADDLEAQGDDNHLVVERDTPPQLVAKADARRVKIILQNLGENAVKYNKPGGRIRVRANQKQHWVVVRVANTGTPIPESERSRMFERFSRGTGENIKGHGLGLNIARELARAHGGDLTLRRSDEDWTEFELRLPSANGSEAEKT
jgi:signal transduction histidine kinase